MAVRKKKNVYLTPEPVWANLKKAATGTEDERYKAHQHAEFFVHYEIDNKAKIKATKDFLKTYKLTKEQRKQLNLLPDYTFVHVGKYIWITNKLGFSYEALDAGIAEYVVEWIELSKDLKELKLEEEAAKPEKKVVTIQQRMREQVVGLTSEWEGYIDDLVDGNFTLAKFEPYNDMLAFDGGLIKANHAKIIKDVFEPAYTEIVEVIEGDDAELTQAYDHLSAKKKKEFLAFFDKINAACDTYIKTSKATRKTRKPKSVSKEKLVAKLKYQINDSKLGIASINPADIIDARELWVYNTKYRKIGVYKADDIGPSLSVKGASIINFMENLSFQKTLRKPEEQLKLFKGNAKTKYGKAFDSIKATDTKLNGRLGPNIVILKAFS